jgi:hypothetical protein
MYNQVVATKTPGYRLFRINYLAPGENCEVRPNYWEFEASNDAHAEKNANWIVTQGWNVAMIPIQLSEAGTERVVRRYF